MYFFEGFLPELISNILLKISLTKVFISPELTHWTVSGEGLIMIIVGGIGSISGAILGATVVHIIQHELSNIINWWMLVIGFGFIFIVLFMEDGLWGLLERIQKKLK